MPIDSSGLKVLHILDHSLPVQSGYAFRSHAIIRSQLKRKWDAMALTSPKHYESVSTSWTEHEEIEGVRYHRSPAAARSHVPFLSEVRVMVGLKARTDELIGLTRPMIVQAHSPVLNMIPALAAARRAKLPVVYEMRSSWEDAAVSRGTYGQGSWKYRIGRFLESWVCRRADHITVICQGLKQDLQTRGIPADKITVIPNGVDVDHFQICDPNEEFRKQWNLTGKTVIGFLGSFFRWEGLDLLVEAMKHLAARRKHLALLLVGGGEMEPELKALVQRLGLKEQVVMPGAVAPSKIPGIYGLVDILAYPRHSMRLTEMVTPLKPLEAMAMGKAMVASNVGGHRELIRDGYTGLLFEAGNASALADAIERLLDAPSLRLHLGTQGRAWVQADRSWSKTTEGYASVYAACLRHNS